MSFWSKIVGFFKGAGSLVSKFFIAILGDKAAHLLGDAALEALKSTLGAIAQNAVLTVSTMDLSSDAKRQEAFKRIVADAKSRGITYSTSMINLLIELAVQRLKENVIPAS